MKLDYTKYQDNYKNYILDCIELDSEGKPLTSDKDKIKYLFDRFNSEYGWNIKRQGKQGAMAEWLSGMAINIPYWNDDIIDLAVNMGSVESEPDEKTRHNICQNYYNFMAFQILRMEDK
tara:strand:+ start:120 stop:476 length:357 start_codon:yes stop_codon:yes gene_type:complete